MICGFKRSISSSAQSILTLSMYCLFCKLTNCLLCLLLQPDLGKNKIINDPVYGLLAIPYESVYNIIEHPYFQRLRRISQLALTDFVYPGARHTRFHHALGAMHLMQQALSTLQSKGVRLSEEEKEAATLAILLHDIGHGPYSHTLEKTLVREISHEQLSSKLMQSLHKEMGGVLDTAIEIFEGRYPRAFLCQLVSSQLDVDRLDYLRRDSFYTGVAEGIIGSDRIIKMMHVHEDELVLEKKSIYSVQKYLLSRSLMYWQVYLHKTVVAAEETLVRIMERAKELAQNGQSLATSPALTYFLNDDVSLTQFEQDEQALQNFALLDDFDILFAVKSWVNHADPILSNLCKALVWRRLPHIEYRKEPIALEELEKMQVRGAELLSISPADSRYFCFTGKLDNSVYRQDGSSIKLLEKSGLVQDLTEASDQYDLSVLTKKVQKYYFCFPKNLRE